MPFTLVVTDGPVKYASCDCTACGANWPKQPDLKFVSNGPIDICFDCIESAYSLMTSMRPRESATLENEEMIGSVLEVRGLE